MVDERGLGGILVHQLGAMQRWRHGFMEDGETPRPEREPLPTPEELIAMYDAEWEAFDAWLPTLTDSFVNYVHEGVPGLADAHTRREPRDPAPLGGRRAAHRGGPLAR